MVPTTEKKKHVYQPPTWIDKKFIETLPKDKQIYWANRIQGVAGQGKAKTSKLLKTADNITVGFDNDGQMVVKTRAMRRHKPPTENKYTKKTHSIKLERAAKKKDVRNGK